MTSLILAFFAGFNFMHGHEQWSWFEGAETAMGIAVAVPFTRTVRRRYAERTERTSGGATEGGTWSLPLQPYGWTKGVMAVAIALPVASIGFMLAAPA